MCTLLSAADWRRHCLVLARERPPSSSFLVSRSHKSYHFFFYHALFFFLFLIFLTRASSAVTAADPLCRWSNCTRANFLPEYIYVVASRYFFFLLIFIFFFSPSPPLPPLSLIPWQFIRQCPYKSSKVYVGSSGIVPIRLAIFIYRHMCACVLAHAHSRPTEGFLARVSTCRKRIHNAWVLLVSSFAGTHSHTHAIPKGVA